MQYIQDHWEEKDDPNYKTSFVNEFQSDTSEFTEKQESLRSGCEKGETQDFYQSTHSHTIEELIHDNELEKILSSAGIETDFEKNRDTTIEQLKSALNLAKEQVRVG